MDWLSDKLPLIIGHRGASAEAPENTLAAFALAVEQGADGVEFDVQLSADGNVVIMHDATVDRTTNGSGPVSRLTSSELRALDAGMGQPVPTLDDVFEAFGPSMLYNIELKVSGLWGKGLESAVADRIDAYHLHNQVVVSSFDPLSLRRARRQLSATTMTGFLWMRGPRALRNLLASTPADHPYFPLVDEGYMAWARERSLRVHVWTVDDPQEARQLAVLGVHALITNRPREIVAALAVDRPATEG
ncbi:MAG TPA: glycerophosphodiester phosphodiesterase family protein [Candidatus Binatia bacterium]|nr:glycerophosphodiester phosphodiesterase family protein [Candidatus Binatia bacterium]